MPDTQPVIDRGEDIASMEPLLIGSTSRHRPILTDLALELAQRSVALSHSLPKGLHSALADLVRSMNCYYSNLIEGHDTHPIDIERALKNDYSADVKNVISSLRPRHTSRFSDGSTPAGSIVQPPQSIQSLLSTDDSANSYLKIYYS